VIRLLLDSHVLVWWLMQSETIGPDLHDLIGSPQNDVFVSIASPWELAIKESLGKMRVPPNLADVLEEERFTLLPITLSHINVIKTLPRHHGDPFDRIMIAQAQVEGLTIVSRESWFETYEVTLLKA